MQKVKGEVKVEKKKIRIGAKFPLFVDMAVKLVAGTLPTGFGSNNRRTTTQFGERVVHQKYFVHMYAIAERLRSVIGQNTGGILGCQINMLSFKYVCVAF